MHYKVAVYDNIMSKTEPHNHIAIFLVLLEKNHNKA